MIWIGNAFTSKEPGALQDVDAAVHILQRMYYVYIEGLAAAGSRIENRARG